MLEEKKQCCDCRWSENFYNNPLAPVYAINTSYYRGQFNAIQCWNEQCLLVCTPAFPFGLLCVCVFVFNCLSLFWVVMSLKLWQMNVHVSRCVSPFVQLLKHVVPLTEIYECHFSAQLYIVTADGSHGQYMLVWNAHPRSAYWHNTCILDENPDIDLEYAHQLVVNMFFEECSRSNKPILICPLPGNVLTWAAGGLKEGTVLNDIGTPWGRRQTLRGSEQVICSALLHVKWDTFTLSHIIFCSSSQPRFLFSPKGKTLQRKWAESFRSVFVEGLLLLFLHLSSPAFFVHRRPSSSTLFFSHFIFSFSILVRLCLFL